MDYVIIGNSAAGIGAVEGIREVDSKGRITLISDEPYHTYSRPLISYYLANKANWETMKFRSNDFYAENNVETKLGMKAVGINEADKSVNLANGEKIEFDKLLVATGGTPFIPPIEGVDKNNIYNFIKLDDAKSIAGDIENLETGKVVILGAGLIGLKAAEALFKQGLEVIVVELADQVLNAILDDEAAKLVQQHLEEKGINFIFEDTVTQFLGEDKVTGVRLESEKELDCDLAIVAAGVKPNIEVVEETDIEVNQGIIVNNKLKTSITNIYAAGDVAESNNLVRDIKEVVPIWPDAYNQGWTAGKNMAGVKEDYLECFSRNSIGFFGLPMITAGIIEPESDDHEVLVTKNEEEKVYKKIILQNDRIIGFIYLNDIDRAGILTGLIKEKQSITEVKDELLADNFGYLSFNKEWRQERLAK
ncbi:NAD(P)/FAD-dependent oxidoreductase [Sporohalobacter salinus]|uniref:NAD(P)/FAD-dependent oxidoreductase n=1 Tax=Sporohalobacter salinus TaxID=1494606 RepID=UPI00196021F5|nr:FAD-dependent oxidoreductase [Sporohalobacter salinus]MBM7622652.1 NAD(P)H-nitrite reductase large subunit [Sporohalobacter salinus]